MAPTHRNSCPLGDRFARAMDAMGPFEPKPLLAVAVSGGADSMALAFLAADWARERHGVATALTVDHRLRAGSRKEALWVRRTLAGEGIEHRILTWRGNADTSAANIQARAREARYRLLEDWCRRAGCLHLLAAHHRDDQAETFMLRLARGSGLYGLAAMAPVVERPAVRLMRPLLQVPGENLRTYLRERGMAWVEDPSNANEAFARVRVRRAMPALSAAGISAVRIAETVSRLGRDRRVLEREVSRLLARAAAPDPAGFVRVERDILAEASPETALRALARLLAVVGGTAYPPRFERLQRLYGEISGHCRTRTLNGVVVRKGRGGKLLFIREIAAVAPPLAVDGVGPVYWDGRFLVRLARTKGANRGRPETMSVGALGRDGWAEIKRDSGGFGEAGKPLRAGLPTMVRTALPALRDRRGVVHVPHLGYRRPGGGLGNLIIVEARPFPPQPLSGGIFAAAGVDSGF